MTTRRIAANATTIVSVCHKDFEDDDCNDVRELT
jgi:hypothetical protein